VGEKEEIDEDLRADKHEEIKAATSG